VRGNRNMVNVCGSPEHRSQLGFSTSSSLHQNIVVGNPVESLPRTCHALLQGQRGDDTKIFTMASSAEQQSIIFLLSSSSLNHNIVVGQCVGTLPRTSPADVLRWGRDDARSMVVKMGNWGEYLHWAITGHNCLSPVNM
jgi:hypothetical protein